MAVLQMKVQPNKVAREYSTTTLHRSQIFFTPTEGTAIGNKNKHVTRFIN